MSDKIAVYVRVSTREQDEDRQYSELQSYLGDDWESAELYVDLDESGSDDSREQFRELRADVRAGDIGRVVAWEASRISRRMITLSEFVDECIEAGASLETVADAFPEVRGGDSEMDRLVAQLIGWVIEFEHQMILARVRSGVARAIQQGKWVGRPPYGFEVVDGYLEIKPDEYVRMAGAVQEAKDNQHRLAHEAKSVSEIARGYGVPRSTLARCLDDDERASLYLEAESDDERVESALDDVPDGAGCTEIWEHMSESRE